MTKMLIDRATVEQALEAFRMCVPMDGKHAEVDAAFKTLRAALADQNRGWYTVDEINAKFAPEQVLKPEPPPEAQTEAEKIAYCAGWWAALEKARTAEPVQEPEPGEYHGWVLREVLFDNGEPVGHREPVQEPRAIRMERVDRSTSQHWWSEAARIRMPSPELYAAGDVVLCWVNEGDMVRAAQPKAALAEPDTCTWQQDGDNTSGAYGTSCGRYFHLEDGTPEDNKMAWCCYCGKKLAQSLITEDEDE